MALCGCLGQAANVTQLTGVDLLGLIGMIALAVQTVRRNREECRQLAQRTDMLAGQLRRLQESEMKDRLETCKPLEGLQETLRQAYLLVASCQHGFSSYVLRFCFCCDLADQLRAVQKEMDLYLRILQLFIQGITYDDLTRLLKQIALQVDLLVEQDGAQVCAESSTSHSNRDSRGQGTGKSFKVKAGYSSGLGRFTFPQLENATNKFSPENQIGIGGSSIVYKGQLPDGREVAVKTVAFTDGQSSFQFENEIELIPKLRHTNIVKILGYCIGKREGILVFEYMPKGSLDCCIYGTSSTEMPLDWSARSRVVKGIAQGALYLTELCGLRIIHGDLKPGNILLDSDMNPKICDFGISKTLEPDSDEGYTHAVMGSPGFAAPEYYEEGRFSSKSDVYSFGATLLQIISGKRAPPSTLTGESRGCGPLNAWAWDLWKERRLMEFVDPSLHDELPTSTAEMTRWVQIALLCVQQHPEERPSMGDVLLMLSCESVILQEPSVALSVITSEGKHI